MLKIIRLAIRVNQGKLCFDTFDYVESSFASDLMN